MKKAIICCLVFAFCFYVFIEQSKALASTSSELAFDIFDKNTISICESNCNAQYYTCIDQHSTSCGLKFTVCLHECSY